MKSHTAETRPLGNLKLRIRRQEMKEYKYQGETFQLDDSKGCYVTVTYKHLKGHVGVNLKNEATDEKPYVYATEKTFGNSADYVTPGGLKLGDPSSPSFESNRDALCNQLLHEFRTEEEAKTFDPAKYCEELHDAVKKMP